MKKLLLISSLLLKMTNAMSGIGLDSTADFRTDYPMSKIDEATRGGIVQNRGYDSQFRLICVEPEAESIEDCQRFSLGYLWSIETNGNQKIVNISFDHSKISLSPEDLSSMGNLQSAFQAQLPELKRSLHGFKRVISISGEIVFIPFYLISGDHTPPVWAYGFLPISGAIALASLPITTVIGSANAAISLKKMNKLFQSFVDNDREVIIRLSEKNYSEFI